MPIYEYRCNECNHEFEVFQKMSDDPVKSCEKCSGDVEKLISQSSFALKGTGWYATDYAKKDKSRVAKESCKATSDACAGCPSAS